mmetsp:Transcript_14561/g.31565  ORF Transcript_14561/g.31565 Transcript_14561/m.31565 type:complete len:229 (-) Transcript_14561:441-1127(-)
MTTWLSARPSSSVVPTLPQSRCISPLRAPPPHCVALAFSSAPAAVTSISHRTRRFHLHYGSANSEPSHSCSAIASFRIMNGLRRVRTYTPRWLGCGMQSSLQSGAMIQSGLPCSVSRQALTLLVRPLAPLVYLLSSSSIPRWKTVGMSQQPPPSRRWRHRIAAWSPKAFPRSTWSPARTTACCRPPSTPTSSMLASVSWAWPASTNDRSWASTDSASGRSGRGRVRHS